MRTKAMSVRHPPKAPVGDCPLVCCSGFVCKEGLIDISEPNLNNDIHPIASESTFEDCPEIDYAILDQALRLLSNLLEQSLPMYHTIFFGELRLASQSPHKRDYEFINESQVLSEEQKAKTRRRLEEMAQYVSFELNQDEGEIPGQAESYTRRMEWVHDDEFWHAVSVVCISPDVYKEVVEGCQPGADPIKRFASIFRFAKELGHELVHVAIFNSRLESFLLEGETQVVGFFFEGGNGTEEGFEWESRSFGGIIDYKYDPVRLAHQTAKRPEYQTKRVDLYQVNQKVSAFDKQIILFQWPTQHIVDLYATGTQPIAVRGAALEEIAVGWHVKAYDIYRLSQQDFWDTDVQNHGIKALHPKLRFGYRYSTPHGGNFQPHRWSLFEDRVINGRDTKVEVFDLRGVPEGYSLSAWGLIEEAQSEEFAQEPRKFKVEEVEDEPTLQTAPARSYEAREDDLEAEARLLDERVAEYNRWLESRAARDLENDNARVMENVIPRRMKFEPAGFTPAPMEFEFAGLTPGLMEYESIFVHTTPLAAPAGAPAAALGEDVEMRDDYVVDADGDRGMSDDFDLAAIVEWNSRH